MGETAAVVDCMSARVLRGNKLSVHGVMELDNDRKRLRE